MNFLLVTLGSSGDVNPFVGIGSALKARGHSVTLATSPYFEDLIRRAGLTFIPTGTREQFEATLDHPDLWHPRRGLRFVIQQGMVPFLRPSYEIVQEFAQSGPCVVLASTLAIGARMAQEKLGVPLVTIHLQPQVLTSLYETPVYPQADVSGWPRWAKRLAFRIGDVRADRMLAPDLSQFRRELSLTPVHGIFSGWVHSPLLTVGLWPHWFGTPQPDWPPQVRLTGFPLFDAASVEEAPAALEAFLNEGSPPVVFTAGSAMRQGRRFFEESVEACRKTGYRGLLLTRFPEQLPASLPDTVRPFGYVPFSRVLPRAAAFVHHGGIGSTSQALAAGIPQIVMPLSHDQPDNAARVKRLGAGVTLPPSQYSAAKVSELLVRFEREPAFRQQAKAIGERLLGSDGIAQTCDLIEQTVR